MDQGVDNAAFTSQAELSDFEETLSAHQSQVQYVKPCMMGRFWSVVTVFIIVIHCVPQSMKI